MELALEESDFAYWSSLLLYGELITKLVTAGLIATISNDPDRLRYSKAHRLVRATGIGDWSTVMGEVLTGPAAQFIAPTAQEAAEATRVKTGPGAWQFEAIRKIAEVLQRLELASELPGGCRSSQSRGLADGIHDGCRGVA